MAKDTVATCAICGEVRSLCKSVKQDNIQQPRICKECLLSAMQTGNYAIQDAYWIQQLVELDDTVSLKALMVASKRGDDCPPAAARRRRTATSN